MAGETAGEASCDPTGKGVMRVQQRPFDLGTPVTVISIVLVELWVGGGQMKRTEMSINRGWINKLCDTQRTKKLYSSESE